MRFRRLLGELYEEMLHKDEHDAPSGQSRGSRPVRERRTPVNTGNQAHCDNGEGVV